MGVSRGANLGVGCTPMSLASCFTWLQAMQITTGSCVYTRRIRYILFGQRDRRTLCAMSQCIHCMMHIDSVVSDDSANWYRSTATMVTTYRRKIQQNRFVLQECFIWCTTFILLIHQVDVSKNAIKHIGNCQHEPRIVFNGVETIGNNSPRGCDSLQFTHQCFTVLFGDSFEWCPLDPSPRSFSTTLVESQKIATRIRYT